MTALVRAAELSPQPADRSRRLIEAAYLASSSGPLDQVPRLLADANDSEDVTATPDRRGDCAEGAELGTQSSEIDGPA